MLTLNRDTTKDEVKNRAYDSGIRERRSTASYDTFRTLEEDYQDTVRENRYQKQDELWGRLNTTSTYKEQPIENYETFDEYDYARNNSRTTISERERTTDSLPYYTTDVAPSMTMKKYAVEKTKKGRQNTQGKIILAIYVMLMVFVATLVIVDSTLKTTSASQATTNTEEYSYINVDDTQDSSTNWFDKLCDDISNIVGG